MDMLNMTDKMKVKPVFDCFILREKQFTSVKKKWHP